MLYLWLNCQIWCASGRKSVEALRIAYLSVPPASPPHAHPATLSMLDRRVDRQTGENQRAAKWVRSLARRKTTCPMCPRRAIAEVDTCMKYLATGSRCRGASRSATARPARNRPTAGQSSGFHGVSPRRGEKNARRRFLATLLRGLPREGRDVRSVVFLRRPP